MDTYIQAIADELVDAMLDKGTNEAEIVAEFAIPLPMMVIADQLGVPREHMGQFKEWSDTAVEPLGMMLSKERYVYCARKQVEFESSPAAANSGPWCAAFSTGPANSNWSARSVPINFSSWCRRRSLWTWWMPAIW
ncbi:MAG: hypothetical protein ACFHXK_09530 [bacterium]